MKWSIRCLTGVALLISALSTASAQTWSTAIMPRGRRAVTKRPTMAGRNMAAAVATNTGAQLLQAFQCAQ